MVHIHHANLWCVWMDAGVVYASKTFNLNTNNHSELLDTNKEQCWQAGWSFKTPNSTKVWLKQKAACCLSIHVLMHQHRFRALWMEDAGGWWGLLLSGSLSGPAGAPPSSSHPLKHLSEEHLSAHPEQQLATGSSSPPTHDVASTSFVETGAG